VLLVVLLALVVAGTVMVAASRRCAQQAIRAGGAERDLQLRWGTLSCQTAVMPGAEGLLQVHETPETPVVLQVCCPVTLGGIKLSVVIADEQAKANVNTLADRRGDNDMAGLVCKLQGDKADALTVELKPLTKEASQASALPRYCSFDQVFAAPQPSQLLGAPPDLAATGPCRRVTCWGSGEINLRRADLETIREVLGGFLNDAQLAKLDELRRNGGGDLASAARPLNLAGPQLTEVQHLVTNGSSCHSVWVVAEGKTRRWYSLYVENDAAQDGVPQRWTFSW
jgi:hypothetical protein